MPGKVVKMSELSEIGNWHKRGQPGSKLYAYRESGTGEKEFVLIRECSGDWVYWGNLTMELYISHVSDLAKGRDARIRPVQCEGDGKLRMCMSLREGGLCLEDVGDVFCSNGGSLSGFFGNRQIDVKSAGDAFLDLLTHSGDINFDNFVLSARDVDKTLAVLNINKSDGTNESKVFSPSHGYYEGKYAGASGFNLWLLPHFDELTAEQEYPGNFFYSWLPPAAVLGKTIDQMLDLLEHANSYVTLDDFRVKLNTYYAKMTDAKTHAVALKNTMDDISVAIERDMAWFECQQQNLKWLIASTLMRFLTVREYVECLATMTHEDCGKDREFKERNWARALCYNMGPIGYAHMEGMLIDGTEPREVVRDCCVGNKQLAGCDALMHIMAWIQNFYLQYCGVGEEHLKLRVNTFEALEALASKDNLPFGFDMEFLKSALKEFELVELYVSCDFLCPDFSRFRPAKICDELVERLQQILADDDRFAEQSTEETQHNVQRPVSTTCGAGLNKGEAKVTESASEPVCNIVPSESKSPSEESRTKSSTPPPPSATVDQHSRSNLFTACGRGGGSD